MRGLIGALLLVPALAAKPVKKWDGMVKATESSVTAQSVARIALSLPRESHDDWERKALAFKLEVLSSDEVCGFGNVTLDNQALHQTLVNGISTGEGSITTDHQSVVAASWAFHCVNVNGVPNSQLMKFIINSVDGKAVEDLGFSVLFRQSGLMEIIHIDTDLSIPDEILANPDPEELEPLHGAEDRPQYNIEEDLAELDYLWAQMHELKHLIHEKERAIAHHTQQHFDNMEGEFSECDSLKCIAKAIAKEAKNAAQRLDGKISGDEEEFDSFGKPPFKKPHFPKFPHHDPKKNGTSFPKHPKGNHTHFPHKPLPICRYPPPPPRHGKRPPPPPPPPGRHDHGPEFGGPPPPHHDGPHDHMPPPPPDFDGPHDGPHDGPPDFDGPPPRHHGHGGPSDFDGPPRRPGEEPSDFDSPFEKHHGDKFHDGPHDGPHDRPHDGPHDGPPDFDGPPPKHDGPHDGPPDFDEPHGPKHSGPPPHGHPHDGPPPKDQEHMRFDGPPGGRFDGPPGPHHGPPRFVFEVVKYTTIGFLLAFLFVAVRRRACTPKRRADRQARREERHRRRAYRRAAHKHIITRILARISGDGSDEEFDDYEEKREALLASAEDGMSTTMTEDITQLRNAAEVVGEMVVAEEERATSPIPAAPMAIPVSEIRPLISDFEMTMLTQVGGEELPAYEDNDGSEEGSFIADGFRYTPGSSDYSPGHSPAGSVSDILGPDSKS